MARLCRWVLVDYDNVIVNIFHEPIRRFYDLDGLWSDCPSFDIVDPEAGLSENAEARSAVE